MRMTKEKRKKMSDNIKRALERSKGLGVKLGAKAKVTEEVRDNILRLRSDGNSYRGIAKLLNVSSGSVHKVLSNPAYFEYFKQEVTYKDGKLRGNRRSDGFGYGVVAHKTKENKCFECGTLTKGMHHVIPVSSGGTKQLPLCELCHGKAHDFDLRLASTVKAGLERAKARGVKLGAPSKITDEVALQILKLREDGLSYKKIALAVGLSVGSVHNQLKRSERVELLGETNV